MPAPRPGQEPHRRPGRLALILAAVPCGLLASAAGVPAAFAVADPGGFGGIITTPAPVRVAAAGGMAGWQITLIALGAAVLAAAAAVFADRTLTARRACPAATVRRLRPIRAQHRPGVPDPGARLADQAPGSQDRGISATAPEPGTLDVIDFDSHLI